MSGFLRKRISTKTGNGRNTQKRGGVSGIDQRPWFSRNNPSQPVVWLESPLLFGRRGKGRGKKKKEKKKDKVIATKVWAGLKLVLLWGT